MNKTFEHWETTKQWCQQHPGRTAAIVTPAGTFSLVWTPTKTPEELKGVAHD
jgi:hypothetical protein